MRGGSHQGYERGEMGDASCMALQGLLLLHVHFGRARASRYAYHLPAGKLRASAASCNKNMHENAKARAARNAATARNFLPTDAIVSTVVAVCSRGRRSLCTLPEASC